MNNPTPQLINPISLSKQGDQNSLRTELALLFHTRQGKLQLTTVHKTSQRNSKVELQSGKPLTPDQEDLIIGMMLQSSNDDSNSIEVIPENVLVNNRRFTMWWIPEHTSAMHFHTQEGRSTRQVTWPSLVLMSSDKKLYITCIKGKQRPSANTELFFAPVANVWNSTELCTGNAKTPRQHGIDSIPLWNSAVLDSAFAHANNKTCIKDGKKYIDPMDYWKSVASKTKFSPSQLVSVHCTLATWFNKVQGERHV